MAKIEEALQELRTQDKRKFIQTVDLIVTLQNFDARKESVNTFIKLPNPNERKICAFLTRKVKIIDTIIKEEFDRYKNPNDIKRLAKKYDFFVAVASVMPAVATTFGRVLGPMGKMPSPQAGIIALDDDNTVLNVVEKMKSLVRVKTKDKSIKIAIGKESMSDKELKENVEAALQSLVAVLPRNKANVKNVLVKFTMTKPIKIDY